jgi:hypothetical protein
MGMAVNIHSHLSSVKGPSHVSQKRALAYTKTFLSNLKPDRSGSIHNRKEHVEHLYNDGEDSKDHEASAACKIRHLRYVIKCGGFTNHQDRKKATLIRIDMAL